ncbi:hypothetical protein [Halococcus sediminicola]|uniref:hypothetical protein n=1 Tax=Halococcus sediminicola TaxID=1264579 RepID=UPI0012ABEE35|nr:hypothetical protein [Halococcus sediminicola]
MKNGHEFDVGVVAFCSETDKEEAESKIKEALEDLSDPDVEVMTAEIVEHRG